MRLGVNIDHIATLREARKINDPNPLDALGIAKLNGAAQITIHLREDRRHIHDSDAKTIIDNSTLPVNLECSLNEEIIDIVCALKPHRATIVPEKRQEVTTEGGLDVQRHFEALKKAISKLHAHDIEVSCFIDPSKKTIDACKELNIKAVEIHTGTYANIFATLFTNLSRTQHAIKAYDGKKKEELEVLLKHSLIDIKDAASYAKLLHFEVAAGHGLNYNNIHAIKAIDAIEELNIGQSIIARAVFTGLGQAIRQMHDIIA